MAIDRDMLIALRADPTPERFMVFADYLQTQGDPRGAELLARARERHAGEREMAALETLIAATEDISGLRPNIDFMLAAICHLNRLPATPALVMFAAGRLAGWLAHALEQQALAGGLLAGLCERLDLDHRITDLVAYVYALLDDQGSQALPVSRLMLERPVPENCRRAWQRGKEEAAAIVEMLAYHRHV